MNEPKRVCIRSPESLTGAPSIARAHRCQSDPIFPRGAAVRGGLHHVHRTVSERGNVLHRRRSVSADADAAPRTVDRRAGQPCRGSIRDDGPVRAAPFERARPVRSRPSRRRCMVLAAHKASTGADLARALSCRTGSCRRARPEGLRQPDPRPGRAAARRHAKPSRTLAPPFGAPEAERSMSERWFERSGKRSKATLRAPRWSSTRSSQRNPRAFLPAKIAHALRFMLGDAPGCSRRARGC